MGTSLIVVLLIAAVNAELPHGWKPCSMSANDHDACFIREVTKAISTLLNGDKKLGVLPLDPLRISELAIPRRDGPVSLDLKFKNIDLSGIEQLKLVSIKSDWVKGTKGKAHVPDLRVTGDYEINGKVLLVPITGKGPCNLTFHDLDMEIDLKWKDDEINGKKVKQMEKLDLKLKPKKLYIQLNNLFNGDKALGDNMNTFMNENWDKILEELSPSITSGLSQALTQISNRILSKLPVEEYIIP